MLTSKKTLVNQLRQAHLAKQTIAANLLEFVKDVVEN